MKSSKKIKYTEEQQEELARLYKAFLNVVEGTMNTVDHIAEVNTETINGVKYIKATNFRMNIRNLKVKLLKDLQILKVEE